MAPNQGFTLWLTGMSGAGKTTLVEYIAARLRQVEASGLTTAEKARLTASLADSYLRGVGLDVLDKRLEALHAVVLGRKEAAP